MRNDKQVGIIAPSDDNLLGVISSTPTDMLTSVYSRTETSDGYDLLSLCTAVTPPAPPKKIEGLFKGEGRLYTGYDLLSSTSKYSADCI